MDQEPVVDVVIVAYNSGDTLRAGVELLCGMHDVHTVVVDNASPRDPIPAIADLPVTVVRAARNGGFSYGCNLGAGQGRAPYVLLLNPDAVIDAASLAALRARLDAEPTTGLAAPRILDGEGKLLSSQRRFPRPRSSFAQALFLHRAFPRSSWSDELVRDPAAYQDPGFPDWVSGACMLVRRSALAAVGGLDEDFFLYCEDTDLCRRLATAGHRTAFVPEAVARHSEGSSAPRHGLLAVHAASRRRYARKHLSRSGAALDGVAVALGAFTHALANAGRRPLARGHARALRASLRPVTAGER